MAVSFEQVIEEQGVLLHPNKGRSMLPLIREGKDLMVITRLPERPLRWLDVVLFRRDNGDYVLHRIMRVREHDYIICGDNSLQLEPVRRDQILGLLTALERGKRTLQMQSLALRIYGFCAFCSWPLRAAVIYSGHYVKQLLRKLHILQ